MFTHSSAHYTVFVSGLCSVYKNNFKALGHGTLCMMHGSLLCAGSERKKIKDCVSWLVKMELVMSLLSIWSQNGRSVRHVSARKAHNILFPSSLFHFNIGYLSIFLTISISSLVRLLPCSSPEATDLLRLTTLPRKLFGFLECL